MSAAPQAHRRPYPRPVARPRLRVVEERRRHTLAYALVLLGLAAAVVFSTVAVNALAATDAVSAARLEEETREAERRYGELLAEVAELEDPQRIEQVAREQLGMVPAPAARFLEVDRPLPSDGASDESPTQAQGDPLKPVLSAER